MYFEMVKTNIIQELNVSRCLDGLFYKRKTDVWCNIWCENTLCGLLSRKIIKHQKESVIDVLNFLLETPRFIPNLFYDTVKISWGRYGGYAVSCPVTYNNRYPR